MAKRLKKRWRRSSLWSIAISTKAKGRRLPMGEIRCSGRTASPGVAIGTLFVLQAAIHRVRGIGTAAEESGALDGAIGAAKIELIQLIEQTEGEAAEILTFQVAMLEDEELAAPARAEIAGGAAADLAWRQALDTQIADYAAADDEYFRARASDLVDIRDRVLHHLSGAQAQALPQGAVIAADD